jgi:NTP pyrophosphatase (non-canonical NTP hydrolase)
MKQLAERGFQWAIAAFGRHVVHNFPERGMRVAEEAIELMQACLIPREQAHKLVDRVYDKEPGDIRKEMKNLLLTFVVFAHMHGEDIEELLREELEYVESKPMSHWKERHLNKQSMGLTYGDIR